MDGFMAPPPPEGGEVLMAAPPEWPPYCDPTYIMPAAIQVGATVCVYLWLRVSHILLILAAFVCSSLAPPQVTVANAQGEAIRIPVSIDKASVPKTYLGGYRHKKTGQAYHHATTQTAAGLDHRKGWADDDHERKAHRDTQTYVTKTRSQMTGREYGTQMKRNDLLMDDSGDVERVAKPYFSSSQLDELKRKKTLIIQCYWRGYVARKRTWNIREALYQDFIAEREALVKVRCRPPKSPFLLLLFYKLYLTRSMAALLLPAGGCR